MQGCHMREWVGWHAIGGWRHSCVRECACQHEVDLCSCRGGGRPNFGRATLVEASVEEVGCVLCATELLPSAERCLIDACPLPARSPAAVSGPLSLPGSASISISRPRGM